MRAPQALHMKFVFALYSLAKNISHVQSNQTTIRKITINISRYLRWLLGSLVLCHELCSTMDATILDLIILEGLRHSACDFPHSFFCCLDGPSFAFPKLHTVFYAVPGHSFIQLGERCELLTDSEGSASRNFRGSIARLLQWWRSRSSRFRERLRANIIHG